MTDRPDPLETDLTRAYFEAAASGRLVVPVCGACGKAHFPPRVACPYCLADAVELRESSGTGTVYAHTVERTGSHPTRGGDAPYALALVRLDDGPVVFGALVDGDPDAVAVGTPVEARFERFADGRSYPCFTLR